MGSVLSSCIVAGNFFSHWVKGQIDAQTDRRTFISNEPSWLPALHVIMACTSVSQLDCPL